MPSLRAIISLSALLATGAGGHGGKYEGPFVASSSRSFASLMDEAMGRMHVGMEDAPQIGDPDRDFVTMMIPHHQGAIDMAKVLLVHGKDPALQQLAKEIIVDQQTEIQMMEQWLARHPAAGPASHKEHR